MNQSRFFVNHPYDEATLMKRAELLAGYTLGELAIDANLTIPSSLKYDKGWIGVLIEKHLGVNAKNKPEPDFASLGIELKTIPINSCGRPLETTFICTLSFNQSRNIGTTWETSYVRNKLSRVLWIPVEGSRHIPLNLRKVGTPFLWSPNRQEDEFLRRDWEELMELIILGEINYLTSRYGEVMQIRPKAAHGKILTKATGRYGQQIFTLPRGFYLKKHFTAAIIARFFYENGYN
ncbi:MAG: DNA mismatch repair endonuclease MutH [Candidatus Dasytiphilus stammeri]